MNKLIKFLIAIWIVIGATGVVTCIVMLVKGNNKDAMYFFIMAIVGALMAFMNKRRYKLYVQGEIDKNKK